MMPAGLSVAIVGCGRIADAHAELIKGHPGARLVAACDRELLMAEQLALRFGIPKAYSDFAEMLRVERPDVVHIATPPDSHFALGFEALSAGCHLFVEKPIGLDHGQAKALIEAACAHSRKLTVGYSNQFDPAALEMRAMIAAGAIGTPVHVESILGYNLNGPFGAAIVRSPNHWVRGLPGQLMQNVIDHLINKIVEFVPDENPRIHAVGYFNRKAHLHDELRVMITGEDVSAYATFSSHIRPDTHILRVHGSKNSLTVDYTARSVILSSYPMMPSVLGRLTPAFSQASRQWMAGARNLKRFLRSEFHFFQGMRTLLDRFYDSIVSGSPPPVSYSEILRTSMIMDRIFAQVNQSPDLSSKTLSDCQSLD
ncbi:MAG: Gfo/Idh/MocA family oxidoreductase [Bryobacteraceae bacterium]|jgi:predicted dehydrogenase